MKPDKFTEDDLLLYWSGELTPEQKAVIDAHIGSDPEAQRFLDEVRVLTQVGPPTHKPPRAFATEAVTELRQQPMPVSKKIRTFPTARILTGAAIAAVLAIMFTIALRDANLKTQPVAETAAPELVKPAKHRPSLSKLMLTQSNRGERTFDSRITQARKRAARIRSKLRS